MHGTINRSAFWHVLLVRNSLGARTERGEAASSEEMRPFVCLQSGERAHVKGPPQFGRGAGVGTERGGRRGRIRRGGGRGGVAAVQGEDAGNGHIHDTLTQLWIQFPARKRGRATDFLTPQVNKTDFN